MSATALLNRLDHVVKKSSGRWIARCPVHPDQSPSLSIRETSDGIVLIKCFAGCGAVDIVAAAGLEMKDLFPEHLPEQRSPLRPNHWHAIKEAVHAIRFEALIVILAARDIADGKSISVVEADRVRLAADRIRSALDTCL